MKKKSIIIILICLLFMNNILPGYTIDPGNDLIHTSQSSVHFTRDYLPLYIGIIGLSTILYLEDENITHSLNQHKNEGYDDVLHYAKYFGDGWFLVPSSVSLLLFGLAAREKNSTALGIYTLEGFMISGLFVTCIKTMTGRARPYAGKGAYYYKPFTFKTAYTSFYSGHTTEAFTFASIFAHYFKNPYVSTFFYSLASLTGIERVYNNKHWASDVFIGAVTGILIGRKIIELNRDYREIRIENDNIKLDFFSSAF